MYKAILPQKRNKFMMFTSNEKQKQLNYLIKRYGSEQNAYQALQIGLQRATEAQNKEAIIKFNELISHFDVTIGIFSLS